MAGKIATGDFVRIRDLAGHSHLAKVEKIDNSRRWVSVKLLTGMRVCREKFAVEKVPVGEAMMLKLLENA